MKTIVETIYEAQVGVHDIQQVTKTHGQFDIPQAYQYQKELVAKYLLDGKKIIGYKMGLTSREKMQQMNVDAPIHGVLFEDMQVFNNKIDYSSLIHPKAEPEVAIKLKNDIPLDATEEEVNAAIGYVAAGIDIIDSRYKDFIFTMADVVADNCSSAQFAIGEWIPYDESVPLDNIQASLFINDNCVSSGISSAVLGSPLIALYELHQSLAKEGETLKKDQIILTGAITAASSIHPGDSIINKTDLIKQVSIS